MKRIIKLFTVSIMLMTIYNINIFAIDNRQAYTNEIRQKDTSLDGYEEICRKYEQMQMEDIKARKNKKNTDEIKKEEEKKIIEKPQRKNKQENSQNRQKIIKRFFNNNMQMPTENIIKKYFSEKEKAKRGIKEQKSQKDKEINSKLQREVENDEKRREMYYCFKKRKFADAIKKNREIKENNKQWVIKEKKRQTEIEKAMKEVE